MKRKTAGINLHKQWISNVMMAEPDAYDVYRPEKVYIPMQQHIGAPCEPTVEKGQQVLVGQVVGKTDQFMSAAVHASVSGKVVDIARYPQIKGGPGLCVVVENDRKDTPCHYDNDLDPANPAEVRTAVRNAGLVGMGGAAFPTHVKLDAKGVNVDTVILNGAECEPGIHADNALMIHKADKILEGGLIALGTMRASRLMVGIEGNKPAAIAAMRKVAAQLDQNITVVQLPTLYPQGGEKQLINSLTGRQVPEGGLPSAAGVLVINVATAHALACAITGQQPLTGRICTVTGDVATPRNVWFPIGTPVANLLDFCGGFKGKPSKLIVGGLMMGATIENLSAPLVKASNGLVAVNEQHDLSTKESPCIRCNRCVEACPMFLVPWKLDRYWRKENMAGCKSFHAQSCINCGCCTYVCPAKRALAEKITESKNKLLQMAKGGA